MGRACSPARARLLSRPVGRKKSRDEAAKSYSNNFREEIRNKSGLCQTWCSKRDWRTILSSNDNMREVGLYFSVSLVAILCYVNSLNGDFIHDDVVAITRNPDVLGKTSISQLFLNDFWGNPMEDPTSHKSYRPLTILTFRFQYITSGLSSRSFHVLNVALHTLVVQLLTFLCRSVLQWSREDSSAAALIFASHPIHTEAVSSNVGRADVLCCVFFLSSFIAFERCLHISHNTTAFLGWLVSSCVLAFFAMLSKEQGITVLAVCIVLQCLPGLVWSKQRASQDQNRRSFFIRIFLIKVLLLLVAFRIWVLRGSVPRFSEQDNPTSFSSSRLTRFLTFSHLVVFNVWLVLCPSVLSYDWQMGSIPLVTSIWDIRNIATALVVLIGMFLIGLVLCTSKKREKISLCISLCFMVIPFLPASNLFVTVGFVVAERILYIPSTGFCILLSIGLQRLKQFAPQMICICRILTVCLVTLFVLRTLRRNTVWFSRESLYGSGLDSTPQNAKVHYNYANLQKDLGNTDLAINHYRIAISLWPRYASAHNNLGALLTDEQEAEYHFKIALSINPCHAKALYNLASLYSKQGYNDVSIELLKKSIKADASFTEPYSLLADIYFAEEKIEDAEQLYLQALKFDPENADVCNNYGTFLEKRGRMDEAIMYYQRAIGTQPNHTAALVNAARSLHSKKYDLKAEQLYLRALAIQEDPQIMDNLGVLYLNAERLTRAHEIYTQLLEKFPEFLEGKVHFAQVLMLNRNYQKAENLLLSVINSNSQHREALHQLANLYSRTNRTSEALLHIVRALTLCSAEDGSCAQIYSDHGDILRDLFDLETAAESYRIALRLDPNMPRVYVNLAVIEHLQGNYLEALRLYEEGYRLDPENDLLLENMKKLKRKYLMCKESIKRCKDCCVER